MTPEQDPDYQDCERIAETYEVEDSLRTFLEEPNLENSVYVVMAVLEANRKMPLDPPAGL